MTTNEMPDVLYAYEGDGEDDWWCVKNYNDEGVKYIRSTPALEAALVGWRDIESAPRDGVTKALYGCFKDEKWYVQITARGRGVGGLHVNVPTGFRSYTGATHWMPPAAT